MKKAVKIFLIIAFAFMGFGLILSVAAFALADFDISKFALTEKELIEQTADIEGKDISLLYIDDISGNNMVYEIRLLPSADEDFHLRYAAEETDDIQWTVENGTLRIFSPASEWYHHITVFGSVGAAPLTIEVPASVTGIQCDDDVADLYAESLVSEGLLDLRCDTDAADVTLFDMTLNTLTLIGSASDIDLEGLNTCNLNINCDTGDVTMKNISAENSLILEMDAGDLEMDAVFANKNLDITVDFGDADLSDISANCILIEMDAGDLDFESLFVTASLDIVMDAGDINGTVNDHRDAFTIFRSGDDFGDTNLYPGGSGAKTLRVTADVGRVWVDFLK